MGFGGVTQESVDSTKSVDQKVEKKVDDKEKKVFQPQSYQQQSFSGFGGVTQESVDSTKQEEGIITTQPQFIQEGGEQTEENSTIQDIVDDNILNEIDNNQVEVDSVDINDRRLEEESIVPNAEILATADPEELLNQDINNITEKEEFKVWYDTWQNQINQYYKENEVKTKKGNLMQMGRYDEKIAPYPSEPDNKVQAIDWEQMYKDGVEPYLAYKQQTTTTNKWIWWKTTITKTRYYNR